MALITECIIDIDVLSIYALASLCPQALTGIAAVRAILVGLWKTANLPDSCGIAWSLASLRLTFRTSPHGWE